jgi:uncharacterized protein YutD
MNNVLETIYDTIAPDYAKLKKPPLREKHFNSIVTCYCLFLCGFFKLQGAHAGEHSMVSFSQHGTWAHLGTQPFIFGSMLGNLVGAKFEGSLVLGLMFSISNILQIYYYDGCLADVLVLASVAYVIFCMSIRLKEHGSFGINEGLIFYRTSSAVVLMALYDQLAFLGVFVIICTMVYINSVNVPLPVQSQKSRVSANVPLKLMYNDIAPLITWQTCIESLSNYIWLGFNPRTGWTASILYAFGLFHMSWNWHTLNDNTGREIVRRWKLEGIKLKGFHSDQAAAKQINRTIEQLVIWNAIVLVVIWALGQGLPLAVAPTTCLLVVQLVAQHVPQSLSGI